MAIAMENGAHGQLWNSCTKWICALEVLPPDTIKSCQDLAYVLRDGVVLCLICSHLDESSVPIKTINHKTAQSQFLSVQNIRLFLAACKNSFGLQESELFEPSVLW